MRPLSEDEMRTVFQKLNDYIGRNIEHLLSNPAEPHSFRLLKDRVYYVSELLLKQVNSLPGSSVLSLGTCVGKFTKGNKFKMHVTALDILTK
jgi:60S ribosome subunit biogenesis protein NIP7